MNDLGAGTIYTETVVYSPPEAFVNDVPYQLAIVELDDGAARDGSRDRSLRRARRTSAIACSSPNFATTFRFFENNHETS